MRSRNKAAADPLHSPDREGTEQMRADDSPLQQISTRQLSSLRDDMARVHQEKQHLEGLVHAMQTDRGSHALTRSTRASRPARDDQEGSGDEDDMPLPLCRSDDDDSDDDNNESDLERLTSAVEAASVARRAARDAVKREIPELSRDSGSPDAPVWSSNAPAYREEEVNALRMRVAESERRQHEEKIEARLREQRLEHELRVALTSTRPPSPVSPPSLHSDTAREEDRIPSYMFKPLLATEIAPIRLSMDEAVVETVWAPTFESFLVCRFPLVYEICVADQAAWQSIIDNEWTDELDRANKWLAQALQQCMLDTPEVRAFKNIILNEDTSLLRDGWALYQRIFDPLIELTGEDVRNLRVKFDTASILVAGSTKIEALSQLETLRRKYHKLPERMRTESQGLELAVAHHLEPINSAEAAMIRKKIYKDQALQRPFR